MEWDRLSGSENSSYQKVFIAIDFLVYFILFFAGIGLITNFSNLLQPGQVYFYILFGLIFATIPSIYDQLTKDDDKEIIDTLSIEEEDTQLHPALANWKWQVGIGLVLSALIGYQIISTQSVWVAYPSFSIRFPFLTGTVGNVANVLFSSLASSWVETRVFWTFLMPTIYNLFQRKYDSIMISLIASIMITSGAFLGYHTFVYYFSSIALFSVFVFALINCLMVVFLRSVVSNFTVHFTNNFLGSVIQISRSMFGIVL